MNPIRVAVVGVGAFGRNHARVYRELQAAGDSVSLAAIVDRDPNRALKLAADLSSAGDVRVFDSVEALLAAGLELDAASVAVPTTDHLAVARALMQAGIDVLIEKPLARTLAEADELIALAAQHRRVAQTGHLERFNPAVRATLALVHRPMFFEVHRLSVFSPRSLDVDVVLDLMIHDLDIVLSFVDAPVREIRAVGIPILSDKVDIANVRLEFDNGCVANFTASRVSTERVRKLRFFQPHQYVSLDYSRQDLFTLTVEPADAPHTPAGDSPAPGGAPGSPFPSIALPSGLRIVPSKPQVVPEEPLRAELRAFLRAVASRTPPLVPLQDGRRALAAALDILAHIDAHARRAGLASITARESAT